MRLNVLKLEPVLVVGVKKILRLNHGLERNVLTLRQLPALWMKNVVLRQKMLRNVVLVVTKAVVRVEALLLVIAMAKKTNLLEARV